MTVSYRSFCTNYRSCLKGWKCLASWTAWPLEKRPTGSPETSVIDCHYMLRKVLKGRRFHLQVGGGLKLRTETVTSLTIQIYSTEQHERSQHSKSRRLLKFWPLVCYRLPHKFCIVFQCDQIWFKQKLK
jgi:hypothetical protein